MVGRRLAAPAESGLGPGGALPLLVLLLAGCHAGGAGPDTRAAGAGHGEGPRRIVTLAPHLAELVYAAGAGERLVGVSAYSDYPSAVRSLPVVGDAFALDRERLALLDADLLLAWQSGTPAHVIDELREDGYAVEVVRTRGLADVAAALRSIGGLTGSAAAAERAAARYEARLAALAGTWRHASPIRVFYQVSRRPLYTIGGDHYIAELLALCGGRNVFADLRELAPTVGEEAVLARDPELLLAPGPGYDEALADWQAFPSLAANRYRNRFGVPADLVGRAGPRLVDAGIAICERLERGRARRAAHAAP